eukprot:TRINITY_DN10373_c1_g1_i1.p1 TRINITY_DN10373_c1_g1~~TRINITY_DN10373_c1_g1_i1.p1  ORF type:complete len:162 (-),score=29.24 TRINITY_DN10373_c1_g1_i1:861-1346(-)
MFYGAMVWDPWLIVAQIACLQCLYYLSLGALLYMFVGAHVERMTLKYFFDDSTFTTGTITGWCTMLAFFSNALFGAGYLMLLIERAKKCLDFTCTMYIIHLLFCLVYNGLPSNVTWWSVQGICLAVMVLLGEWLCMRREQLEIPVRGGRMASNQSARTLAV